MFVLKLSGKQRNYMIPLINSSTVLLLYLSLIKMTAGRATKADPMREQLIHADPMFGIKNINKKIIPKKLLPVGVRKG